MRVIQIFAVLFAIGVIGVFVAPSYQYSEQEQLRLKEPQDAKFAFLLWPLRAYENWRICGDISYCREVRCAALEGGCAAPAKTAWELGLIAPERAAGESDNEWTDRIGRWCAGVRDDYEAWTIRREAAVSRCEPEARGGGQAAPENSNASGPRIDIGNLTDCSILRSRPTYVAGYEQNCR